MILDVTVAATGQVTRVQVDRHGTDAPAALQMAAITAAQQWKFNPGHTRGKPVGGVLQVPVHFSLNDEQADAGHSEPCPAGNIFDVQASTCIPDAAHSVPRRPRIDRGLRSKWRIHCGGRDRAGGLQPAHHAEAESAAENRLRDAGAGRRVALHAGARRCSRCRTNRSRRPIRRRCCA